MIDNNGMFKPGVSGNPSGRPKTDKTIRALAREHTKDALEILVSIAKNTKINANARINACIALLDRAWGKPIQYNENLDTISSEREPRINHIDLEERIKQLTESSLKNKQMEEVLS